MFAKLACAIELQRANRRIDLFIQTQYINAATGPGFRSNLNYVFSIHLHALVRERFNDVTLEVAQLLNKRCW